MKFRYIVNAWYIDDGVIIEGVYAKSFLKGYFFPKSGLGCGFDYKRIYKKEIGKSLFFAKALADLSLRLNSEDL